MADKKANFTPKKEDIEKINYMNYPALMQFPYIEGDFDANTEYQMMCKIVEYLNKVIKQQNEVGEQSLSLFEAFTKLQQYVNDYYDDMDVINFELIKTEGLAKTYRITFYNHETYEFTVYDGRGVTNIEKISTDVLTDTYRINYNDGTNSTFEVENGRGIVNIRKKSSNMLTDTYEIVYNDNTTSTFDVMNGKQITGITVQKIENLTITYQVNYNDGSFDTFVVENGNGIERITTTMSGINYVVNIEYTNHESYQFVINGARSIEKIEKISTQGLVDTYQITFNDNKTQTFTVTNGAQGPQGPVGPVGPANTLTIGTVENGGEASATITGEAPNQVLNLVLPEGPQGPQGPQGPVGPAGDVGQFSDLTIGTVTSGDVASAEITGEPPHQVLNLVLPEGPQGPAGEQGQQGPQGPAGEQGQQGPQGPQGPAGTLDETVLYTDTGTTTNMNLSENANNFEYLDIYYVCNNNYNKFTRFLCNNLIKNIQLTFKNVNTNTEYLYDSVVGCTLAQNGNYISYGTEYKIQNNTVTEQSARRIKVAKIVGVNRINN